MNIRVWLICGIACFLAGFTPVKAQQPTEAALMDQLFRSLQYNDPEQFSDLFPGVDSLSAWVIQYADKQSVSYRKMQSVQHSPYYRMQYDSAIRKAAIENFTGFLKRAGKLRVYWNETLFMRYELEANRRGRGLLTEKITSLRFLGYVFFKDQLTQKIYCFTVADILQVNGQWYGGELFHIFRAETKEQYKVAFAKEQKRLRLLAAGDSTQLALEVAEREDDEDMTDKPSALKEVVQRKYYRGKFDNEIRVELYVRYIKGPCDDGVCSWEALFRYGDEDEFVKMTVAKTPEGHWVFTEELGSMELILNEEKYSGMYATSSDKTEYEVLLKEAPVKPKKLFLMDEMLDLELHGE